MRPPTPRTFTILDGMILVAAVAGAFAIRRTAEDAIAPYSFNAFHLYSTFFYRAIEAVFPFLVTLTPAMLILRLRRPRPRWRRLLRQPGTAACLAAMVPLAAALYGLWQLARFLEHPEFDRPPGVSGEFTFGYFVSMPAFGEIYGAYGTTIGLWVLGAWLVLALSGRRRPERRWIDRLGRLVGIGWLSILPMRVLAPFL